MKQNLLQEIICPICSTALEVNPSRILGDEVFEGELLCANNHVFPIQHSIPRFVENHYSESFGMQWKLHAKTQIDKYNGTTISAERFWGQTAWSPEELVGKRFLDAGAGAGRFTQVALDARAIVYALDASNAVEVNKENNAPHSQLHIIQADLLSLPFPKGLFDYIICFGVLQHTPDPKKTFLALVSHLKVGGKISIDVYPKKFKYMIHPKYRLRSFTKHFPPSLLYRIVKAITPLLMPISTYLREIPFIGRSLAQLVPIANYTGYFPLDRKQLLDWAILDTFDMFSPKHDNPQTKKEIDTWFREIHFSDYKILDMGSYVARGTKSLET